MDSSEGLGLEFKVVLMWFLMKKCVLTGSISFRDKGQVLIKCSNKIRLCRKVEFSLISLSTVEQGLCSTELGLKNNMIESLSKRIFYFLLLMSLAFTLNYCLKLAVNFKT
jgi:hypothetical protein